MKRLILFIFPIALFFAACGEDSGTSSSGGEEYVLRYPEESAMLALVESREFRPPKNLQIQIDRELTMIRDQWGDSIPEVLIKYRDPWVGKFAVYMVVDSSLFGGSESPERRMFDSVLAHFGAIDEPRVSTFPQFLRVVAQEPWYPPAAVDSFAYASIPGVSEIATPHVVLPEGVPFTSIVRQMAGARPVWYFSSSCNEHTRYHVFDVRGRRARFVDELRICLPDQVAAYLEWYQQGVPYDSLWLRERAYHDSVIASAPEWYDLVARELREMYAYDKYYKSWPEGK
jgi:hypothetical protein